MTDLPPLDEPKGAAALTEALIQITELLDPVASFLDAYRSTFTKLGFQEGAVSAMCVQAHGFILTLLARPLKDES